MKRIVLVALAVALALGVVGVGGQSTQAMTRGNKILVFDSMVGLPPALTGTQNPIRGVNGGGLPWELTAAAGRLQTNGELDVVVEGLVFSAGPNAGKNTIPNFRAIVSCLTTDGEVVNVSTGLFPATTGPASEGGGNARIRETLALPQPCLAPIVFVTSPSGAWFAVTGG